MQTILQVRDLVIMKMFLCIRKRKLLTTGNQLKAARALAGLEQTDVAEQAGVAVTTIRKMEWKGAATLSSGLNTIKRVQNALEAAGVEFLNHGQPGVRLRDPNFLRQGHDDATVADLRQGAAMLHKQRRASGTSTDPQALADSLEREIEARQKRGQE